MRKLLFALVGALLLQLGLLQAALADTTSSAPSAATTTTSTSTTTAPTTTTTAPQPDTGVLSRTPAAGPVGTHISVTAKTPCVPLKGATAPEVEVDLFNPNRPNDDALAGDVFPIAASGAWQGELVVPTGTKAGSYALDAACFPNDNPNSEPYFIYDAKSFTVTATSASSPPASPSSRPATAVSGTPNFTG